MTAIVLANLSVFLFGPKASIINAFLFIGLDITARDKLHESWHRKGLLWKMTLLVAAGSLITISFNLNTARIALASFIAFSLATLADTLAYSLLFKRKWLVKANLSNLAAATVDSLVFPTIAFGSFLPLIVLGQLIAKLSGGAIWAIILRKQHF